MWIWQPKFGGKIIDIVSGDIETPEQKSEALSAVYSTIFAIFLIVVIGYAYFTTLEDIGFPSFGMYWYFHHSIMRSMMEFF